LETADIVIKNCCEGAARFVESIKWNLAGTHDAFIGVEAAPKGVVNDLADLVLQHIEIELREGKQVALVLMGKF
jgi:hypothetical protein